MNITISIYEYIYLLQDLSCKIYARYVNKGDENQAIYQWISDAEADR